MKHRVHLLQDNETTIGDWLRSSGWLHRTLRPALPCDYIGYLSQMFSEVARMAVLPISAELNALAVYRIHQTTLQGLPFYLDDLVTDELERGRGLGAALLDWCETFALDSGVQRADAHRFYFRQSLPIGSFGFAKPFS